MSTIDPRQFRNVLGHFLSGVTVITTRAEAGVRGMTASAFSSLSMDPPLVLVCVAHKAHMHDLLQPGGRFAVSILSEAQQELSNHFAGYAPNARVDWDNEWGQTPVLQGALAWMDCAVHSVLDGGDHSIVVGRVEALAAHEGAPLAYYRGKYGKLTSG